MTNIEIGDNVRKLRELKGYSQETLAIEIGISQKQMSRYEKGQTSMTIETLFSIAKELHLEIGELLNFDSKLIFNNYSQYQQGGQVSNYNNTEIEQVEKMFNLLLAEKERTINLLMSNESNKL